MNRILAKRYAFCDFSSIAGFPNQVPARDEWEISLPRFHGEEWEVPAEHLLDFHDYMHRLQVVHEDVQIRLFCFSLEGIARDWYRSLPNASVSSLADFHDAFHVFCKDIFSADLLFPECCHEFNLLKVDLQGKHAAEENTLNHDPECIDVAAACVISSPHLPNLQTKADFSINEENDGGEELNSPDQQPIVYVPLAKIQQSTFINEFGQGNEGQLQHSQLEQPSKEVLLCDFDDPFADYLESMSSIYLKNFLPEKEHLYHLFELLFCAIWFSLFPRSRSIMMSVNQFLSWLHWKSSFT
jgi:hypothetical protein